MGTLGNREVKRNNDGNAKATSIKKWHRELNNDHDGHGTSPNKRFMSKTISCVRVRYKSLYNSLTSSEKQEREMTKFCVV